MRANLLNGCKARLEASLAHSGINLPWWVPACTKTLIAVFALVGVVERSAPLPSAPIALAGLLAVCPALVWAVTGVLIPIWLDAAGVVAAVAIMLFAHPIPADFSVVLLVISAAELATTSRPAVAITVSSAGIMVLGAAQAWGRMTGSLVDIGAVLLGFSSGLLLRWYVRALDAERRGRDAVREQAILAERQRIAQEVHDVVGHSLSITLLHLTGARRALQQDRDVDEAVEALTEAETVGRAAMADIRRAVGLLGRSPAGTRPLPGVDDIAGLVERTRAAGLDVRYEQQGDLAAVGATEGLGLYRIAQESLANVAKHAPDATAQVRLFIGPAGARLTVRSDLPRWAPSPAPSGSGLTGMSARAAQLGADLRAGPSGKHWVVDVTVPSAQPVGPVTS